MAVFVDTSALFALLDADDRYHAAAWDAWRVLAEQQETLLSSNYVLVETSALAGRRLGFEAVREFEQTFVPLLRVHWVDALLHERAVAALLTAGDRRLSLVDCVSFEAMRRLGLDTAFGFDAHFAQQGFRCIPQPGAGG